MVSKFFVDPYDDNYRANMVQFLTSLDDEIRYNDTEVEKAPYPNNQPSYFIGDIDIIKLLRMKRLYFKAQQTLI